MYRPIAFSQLALLAALVSSSPMGTGCASGTSAVRERERLAQEDREARHSHVQQAHYADDASPEMTVSGEEGTLNESDVESALQEHAAEMRECLHLGRRPAPVAGGRVILRFFVDEKGEVQDVSVLESNLGNHAIEHCLVDVGLGVMFERPAGHKPTTFDYPLEFRASRQASADRQRRP